MNPLKSRIHIFVSLPPRHVNGLKAYDALVNSQDQKFAPSQQILFLFSGGYLPGMGLLGDKAYVNKFWPFFWSTSGWETAPPRISTRTS